MLLNCGVHCVWSEVQFTGPRDGAIIKPDLRKQRRVGKRGEYASLWRMNQARQIDRPLEAIGKCNPQPEPRKGFDFGYPPRRAGRDLVA
jgi:hypothetical protein